MKEITISEVNQGQRADKFVRKYLHDAPLSFIYKLFRIKDVKVNGKRIDASYILSNGDVLQIYVTDKQLEEFSKPREIIESNFSLDILYEDENILMINKPSGILVHGDEQEKRRTLTNYVLNYLNKSGQYDTNMQLGFTPAPCHRLDRNTSGIVIYGKNMQALQELELLFKDKKEIKKEYYVLVAGKLYNEGKIDVPLKKDEKNKKVSICSESNGGKKAVTIYKSLHVFAQCSLINAQIITGRTHQIRVHFASLNHPVLGDNKYGNFSINHRFEEKFHYKNQFLHAHKITFLNISGKLSYLSNRSFDCPLPEKEQGIVNKLLEQPNDQLF